MTEVKRSYLSYAARLLKWQAFGFALVALGRAIVRAERTHGRGAWQMAIHLEIAAAAAAHELGAELSGALTAAPDNEDEMAALEHLAFIRTLFLVLALFARNMRTQLAGRGAPIALHAELNFGCPPVAADQARALPPYLNSS